MAIKAVEYTVGFNAQQAKAEMAVLVAALKDGGSEASEAIRGLSNAFEQTTRSHKTARKEGDAWTKLIKDEKAETRNLGFLMRNSAESVGTLADAFGGPSGLGQVIGSTYGRFDQITFAFEALEVAGTKAGGSFAKMAGVLGGIAIPAGIGITAFSMLKDQFEKDTEEIEGLSEAIRALKLDLGSISSTKVDELNRKLADLSRQRPDMSFFTSLSQVAPGMPVYLLDIAAQTLDIEKQTLEVIKAKREERARELAFQLQTVSESYSEWQALYAFKAAEMSYLQLGMSDQQKSSASAMRSQIKLVDEQIAKGNEYWVMLISQKATMTEQLSLQTKLMQLLKEKKELEARRDNASAEADVYGSASYLGSKEWLRGLEQNARALRAMEERNAPSKPQGVAAIDPLGTDEVLANFTSLQESVLSIGDTLAGNLASGFMKGFESGKFMLSDFTNAMAQSMIQLAAQQAALAGIAGLLSLFTGGPFGVIFKAMGGMFGGGSGKSSSGSNPKPGPDMFGQSYMLPRGPVSGGVSNDAIVSELRMMRDEFKTTMRHLTPTVYVGGVISPDEIVSENLRKSERRLARRSR